MELLRERVNEFLTQIDIAMETAAWLLAACIHTGGKKNNGAKGILKFSEQRLSSAHNCILRFLNFDYYYFFNKQLWVRSSHLVTSTPASSVHLLLSVFQIQRNVIDTGDAFAAAVELMHSTTTTKNTRVRSGYGRWEIILCHVILLAITK